jgi:uncharacterized protein YbaA (DUF1428 family)
MRPRATDRPAFWLHGRAEEFSAPHSSEARCHVECLADDVKPDQLKSFPQAIKLEPDGVVVLAWIGLPVARRSQSHPGRSDERSEVEARYAIDAVRCQACVLRGFNVRW